MGRKYRKRKSRYADFIAITEKTPWYISLAVTLVVFSLLYFVLPNYLLNRDSSILVEGFLTRRIYYFKLLGFVFAIIGIYFTIRSYFFSKKSTSLEKYIVRAVSKLLGKELM